MGGGTGTGYVVYDEFQNMPEGDKLKACLDLTIGMMERTQGFTIIPSGSLTVATGFIRDYEGIRSSIGDEVPENVLRGYDKQMTRAKIYFRVDV